MRTQLFLLASLVAASSGCKWTEFDDLADKTWVRATNSPNIGSTQYAVAIAGVTPMSATTGGELAVVSSDVPNLSTLEYSQSGDATVGANAQKLGIHFISSLSDPPILVTDTTGKAALVERAIDAGNIAVVLYQAGTASDAPFGSMSTPDSATFVGANVLVAAGPTFYTVTGMGAPTMCTSNDTMLHVAAMASDGTDLWVWTQAGAFGSVPIASLTPCTGGNLPSFGTTFTTPGVMPTYGSQMHLVGTYAILVAPAVGPTPGSVLVVDKSNLTQVGATMSIAGLRSSAVDDFGGVKYLALGIPGRAVDGLMNAGQVELYDVNTTSGMLGSPIETLNDAQPESGQEFGRAVTSMKFNNQPILVVGAHSEVFAYYKTSLYGMIPQ